MSFSLHLLYVVALPPPPAMIPCLLLLPPTHTVRVFTRHTHVAISRLEGRQRQRERTKVGPWTCVHSTHREKEREEAEVEG